jgi:succinate dehydrogenase / fumarate reductase cytochrome b subunit
MSNTERPLSPHLSIYRWPITMTISILHRITGVAMSIGLIVLAYWLLSISSGGAQYEQFATLMSTLLGRLCLIGWSFAFFLHLANGIRHLIWDIGRGFEIKQANASAWFVLLLAIALTAIFWVLL